MTKIISFKPDKEMQDILTNLPKHVNHSEFIREKFKLGLKFKNPLK